MSELEEENASLLGFLYACPTGLAEMSADGSIGMINPRAMQMLIPLAAQPSLNFFELMDAYAPELRNLVEGFSPRQGNVCEDHRVLITPNKEREAETKVYACTLVKLEASRFMIALSDISRQVQHERKLKEAEAWFSSLMDGSHDIGVATLDAAGLIESVNDSVVRQTGYSREEVVGKTLDVFSSRKASGDALSAQQQILLAQREGWYLNETWQQKKDGTPYWCQRLVTIRREEEEVPSRIVFGYTVIFREGTQRTIDIHHLKRMLTRDYLTDTYNRMHFFEIAEKECARSTRYGQTLSLILLDVDHFKQVNDRYGHPTGDIVLKTVAERCKSLLRPSDTMARIGGEEFAILLPSTNSDGALHLAERLRSAIADDAVETPSGAVHVTSSFGCVGGESGSCALTHLMERADKALYQAKNAGRNCVIASEGK